MRAVVQRVSQARVTVDGAEAGAIGAGFMVLVGVTEADGAEHAELLARKTAALRVFEDDAGKMNRALADVGGAVLAISQFTLCADTSRGNRPSFATAAPFERGRELYEHYCASLAALGIPVARGVFGAHMQVQLVNDGPVTICLDTDVWSKKHS